MMPCCIQIALLTLESACLLSREKAIIVLSPSLRRKSGEEEDASSSNRRKFDEGTKKKFCLL